MPRANGLNSAAERILANLTVVPAATIAVGATTTAFTTTGTISYTVDGRFYSKSAMTNQALAVATGYPAFKTQPANTTVYYVLALDSAGTPTTWQGTYDGEVLNTDPSGLSVYGDGSVPDVPNGFTPFAIMKIVSGGSAFTPASTALTSISTFVNVMLLPSSDTPF